MKKIFYLLFISIVLTSFANATEMTAFNVYPVLWVEVEDKPNNDEDWIGVYPKNASNSWSNVIAWKWARDGATSPDKPNTDEYRFLGIADGDYEVRFFLNNTFKTEYKASVSLFDPFKPSINITNATPAPNESIPFKLGGILSGDQDWVGIYPKDASNDWNNVLTWSWAENREVTLTGVPAGQYEARLFFNNSFNLEAKVAFTVENNAGVTISTDKTSYAVNENISTTIGNQAANNQNWIGIYPVGSSNAWGNVLTWEWTNGNNSVNLDGVPAGQYEARLFYNNSFILEANVNFNVGGGDINYAAYGSYTPIRTDISQTISIYKPQKNGTVKQHSPVIIVSSGGWGSSGSRLESFINFIVSKGYFVIGVGTRTDRDVEFNRILETLNQQGNLVDTSKIGLMGTSTGGGTIFYNLKKLKDEGYATNNFVISLDGWFTLGLTPNEVRNLDTTTLLLQFGGADGVLRNGLDGVAQNDNDHYQDPRILMSVYDMLPGNKKSLSFLNNSPHGYAQGSMDGKENLLRVVGAMLSYKFENGGEVAKNVALNNHKYDEINAAKFNIRQYRFQCDDLEVDGLQYNYCDVNNPQVDSL